MVVTTVYADKEISPKELEETRRQLAAAAEVPVEIHATVVEGRVIEARGGGGAKTAGRSDP